jgi:DNA-binding SARP family transcriptional activator
MSVEFRLLGDIEVRVNERLVDSGHARQRRVLAVLLMSANQVVPVESMVGRVWGPRAPRSARNTLRSYLVRIRHALAECDGVEIVRRSGGYVLSATSASVDVHRFRELAASARAARGETPFAARALELWRGEPFAGVDTPWFNEVRAALLAERFALELDHTDLLLRKGKHAQLVTDLTARSSAHPMDERVAGQLMLALYRCGRQAEALSHYTTLRTHLADTLGVDPGPHLRELHQRILNGDLALTAPPVTVAPVPRQLPGPPRTFVGRVREQAELDEATDQDALVIAAIGGRAGIGKTWLALHWAHQNTDRFPDGQLYLDLHGSGSPTRPEEALRSLLNAFAVPPSSIPPGLDARAGLFRSLVAGRRMLIVLDDAAGAGQVVTLLPGSPTCTVLVTSRDRLDDLVTAHGAQAVTLDALRDTEADELLARHVGRGRVDAEPQAVRELLAHCAGLPLAIATVATHAARHPDFPLAELAAEFVLFRGPIQRPLINPTSPVRHRMPCTASRRDGT